MCITGFQEISNPLDISETERKQILIFL